VLGEMTWLFWCHCATVMQGLFVAFENVECFFAPGMAFDLPIPSQGIEELADFCFICMQRSSEY
jgi:hypothetical protein